MPIAFQVLPLLGDTSSTVPEAVPLTRHFLTQLVPSAVTDHVTEVPFGSSWTARTLTLTAFTPGSFGRHTTAFALYCILDYVRYGHERVRVVD
ncbi:MAG: hypothetical protein QMD10_10300 [Desulfitobacteriaceae bacterium]|nr:hypothetical protein [Desulfitobacteriaceae bacterium]